MLAALQKGESYGYKIVDDLLPCLAITESTLYPILRRLEIRGEVSVRTEEHAGRLRKYYSLTELGKTRLECFSITADTLRKITDYIQSGG